MKMISCFFVQFTISERKSTNRMKRTLFYQVKICNNSKLILKAALIQRVWAPQSQLYCGYVVHTPNFEIFWIDLLNSGLVR